MGSPNSLVRVPAVSGLVVFNAFPPSRRVFTLAVVANSLPIWLFHQGIEASATYNSTYYPVVIDSCVSQCAAAPSKESTGEEQ